MDRYEPIELCELVDVPNVGTMWRAEVLTPDGELLEVLYRWPSSDESWDETVEFEGPGEGLLRPETTAV